MREMTKEKQIEEMAKIIVNGCREGNCEECKYSEGVLYPDCVPSFTADALYKQGYRNASEVVEDIFSDFESILFSLMYLDFDGKYHLRKMNADRVTMIFERYYKIEKKYTEEGK